MGALRQGGNYYDLAKCSARPADTMVEVITIDNIFQDEPVDTKGDGSFTPDSHGVGTSTAGVRAERADTGDGRVYHIRFTANDAYGGSCSDEVLVGVPKSQGREGSPIDGGALFDSTVAAWRR